jgi:hypothetical protein
MEDQIEDLWPDLNPSAIETPAYILKTQAAVLSKKSKGLLHGEVESWPRESFVHHQLSIVVPALDNYRYVLLRVHHSFLIYPVFVDESPIANWETQIEGWSEINRQRRALKDEHAFRDWLRKVLAAPETRNILENLMAQATT